MLLTVSDGISSVIIIIIMLPNQAIASTPSAPRPSGAEGRGSTAPLCLQLLRTSAVWTSYSQQVREHVKRIANTQHTGSWTE
jgi:hypothetical protein